MPLNLYALAPPARWRAGRAGAEDLYFDCGHCGAAGPVIHGFLGAAPTFPGVAVLRPAAGPPLPARLALFCEPCWAAVCAAPPNHFSAEEWR